MLQITISKRAALIIGVALLLVIPGVATATHIFTDVVDGSTHAEGIEWVADAGVTTGCGDGTIYCPNDAVNRAQMGTFMCRLAGNCGVAPSVNADQVDGYDALGVPGTSGVSFSVIEQTNVDVTSPVDLASRLVSVPGPGYVVVTFSGYAIPDVGDRIVLAASDTSGGWGVNSGHVSVEVPDADVNRSSFSHTMVYEVGAAGLYTYYATAFNTVETDGDGEVSVYGKLVVEYFPNDLDLVLIPLGDES